MRKTRRLNPLKNAAIPIAHNRARPPTQAPHFHLFDMGMKKYMYITLHVVLAGHVP